jgi:hypothetical protein
MKTSDLSLSIIIVFIFLILYIINVFVVGYRIVKENWPIYKCNPMIMPFASFFGHDTADNFTYCVQKMQTSFMGTLLKPINSNINAMSNVAAGLTNSTSFIREFSDSFSNNLGSVFSTLFSTFYNVMIEIQKTFANLKDTFGKLIGIMITMMYILSGSMMTMESLWNGPPGQMIKFLCFHPDTKLTLKNGEKYSMKDLPLNSVLKNGAIVGAVMNISNLDKNGKHIESMYKLPRNHSSNADHIIVSGSHLVYDTTVKQFVPVKEVVAAEHSEIICDTLACLITSDHTIAIGDWLFHDWEDNNGSPSKTFGI